MHHLKTGPDFSSPFTPRLCVISRQVLTSQLYLLLNCASSQDRPRLHISICSQTVHHLKTDPDFSSPFTPRLCVISKRPRLLISICSQTVHHLKTGPDFSSPFTPKLCITSRQAQTSHLHLFPDCASSQDRSCDFSSPFTPRLCITSRQTQTSRLHLLLDCASSQDRSRLLISIYS